jgi:hypothetical protein
MYNEEQTNNFGCPENRLALKCSMRHVWLQHVYWTRLLLISIAERLNDEADTTARLLKNPADIADIFACYFGEADASQISALLTEHLKIGAALITTLRDEHTDEAEKLTKEWYINADEMAKAFSEINPYYNYDDLKKMLNMHLDLTTKEVAARLAGKYKEDIKAFAKVEKEALTMADYFVSGIIWQFP